MENNFRPDSSDSESEEGYDSDIPDLLSEEEDYDEEVGRSRSRSSGREEVMSL